jgi:hypothetical protein
VRAQQSRRNLPERLLQEKSGHTALQTAPTAACACRGKHKIASSEACETFSLGPMKKLVTEY